MKPINELKQLALEYLTNKHPNVPKHAIPIPKYSDKTSNGLTKMIIEFIQYKGGQAERISIISRKVNGKFIKSAMQVGTADISATIHGKSVKIEVKIGKDKQSKEQKIYEQEIKDAGGYYYIAKDFNLFYAWYNENF